MQENGDLFCGSETLGVAFQNLFANGDIHIPVLNNRVYVFDQAVQSKIHRIKQLCHSNKSEREIWFRSKASDANLFKHLVDVRTANQPDAAVGFLENLARRFIGHVKRKRNPMFR